MKKPLHAASRGLVVWAEKGRDHWGNPAAQSATKSTRPGTATTAALASLNDAERGGPLPGAEGSLFTTQLEPLVEPGHHPGRGVGHAGARTIAESADHDSPPRHKAKPRRRNAQGGDPVSVGRNPPRRIPIGQGVIEARVHRDREIASARWPAGLPPGQYTLRVDAGLETVTFTVEGEAARRRVMKPLDELLDLLGRPSDPLYIQVAVERLFSPSGMSMVASSPIWPMRWTWYGVGRGRAILSPCRCARKKTNGPLAAWRR